VTVLDSGRRLVHIDLRDRSVRYALCFAVDQAGWIRTRRRGPEVAAVADRAPATADAPPLDVLVVHPAPAISRAALDAFGVGTVRAIVATTDPGALPRALEAARQHLCLVSRSVLDAAQAYPLLGPRLERTLQLVVRGRPNRDIARELGQSEATTKRDIAELLRRFDAPNRVALAATALRLGLPSDGRP
jgi:DNA-binding NarL/FixJ family response regulator